MPFCQVRVGSWKTADPCLGELELAKDLFIDQSPNPNSTCSSFLHLFNGSTQCLALSSWHHWMLSSLSEQSISVYSCSCKQKHHDVMACYELLTLLLAANRLLMLSDCGFAATCHVVNHSHLGRCPLHCFLCPCLCLLTLIRSCTPSSAFCSTHQSCSSVESRAGGVYKEMLKCCMINLDKLASTF